MAAIELNNIVKRYGVGARAVQVLHGVSAQIHDGEFVVLVGPSGCGKSTLLRMVAGLEDITEGDIRIGNKIVNDLEPAERDIAMVFQNYALYPHMTVFDNMAYGLKIAKVSSEDIKKRVHAAASALELSHLLERKPKELSGGQRQRVAMGRAIVRQPQVFLFDEPLSNLDAKLRAHTRLEIQKLHRELGTTSLFVTHDQVEAMTLAQRMLVMNEGRLQQFGTPEEVYNRPANTFVAGFIGAPPMNLLHELSGIDARTILGIRPEHLRIKNATQPTDNGAGHRFSAQVYALEMLGAERLVYARIGNEDVVVRTDVVAHSPAIGDVLELIAEHPYVHWFDKKTGLRQQ
jgi:sn-glycerol 3-phosphate transport system ATP-binding protein